jgi:hypothetical protein
MASSTKVARNLPPRIVAWGVGVLKSRGSVPSSFSWRMVRAEVAPVKKT